MPGRFNRGRGFGYGRGFGFAVYPAVGYAPAYGTYGYGGWGRGFGRGIGATLGYCPYTGLPRGWRWFGYGTPYYQSRYPYAYPMYQQYRGDE